MSAAPAMVWSRVPASHLLGRKLDSIPFSPYHVVLIVVLGFVGFIEGYDLALSGSLLVLAKQPLNLDPDQIRALAVWPTFVVVLGGFAAAAMSDRISRVAVMQVGVVITTLCTLLILLAQDFTQLLVLRLVTGIGLGFTISAPFPIAAELMPAQHRRTYAGIYEVMLASAFTLLPFVGFILAESPERFPSGWIAWWRHLVRRTGAHLLPDPREPTLAAAARPGSGCGRHGQPGDPAMRQPGGANDDGRARVTRLNSRSTSCRPSGNCSRPARSAGPLSAYCAASPAGRPTT